MSRRAEWEWVSDLYGCEMRTNLEGHVVSACQSNGGSSGRAVEPPGREHGKYRISITDEALKSIPTTVFDPPENVWFADRQSALEFCRRLNQKLGYERFVVREPA